MLKKTLFLLILVMLIAGCDQLFPMDDGTKDPIVMGTSTPAPTPTPELTKTPLPVSTPTPAPTKRFYPKGIVSYDEVESIVKDETDISVCDNFQAEYKKECDGELCRYVGDGEIDDIYSYSNKDMCIYIIATTHGLPESCIQEDSLTGLDELFIPCLEKVTLAIDDIEQCESIMDWEFPGASDSLQKKKDIRRLFELCMFRSNESLDSFEHCRIVTNAAIKEGCVKKSYAKFECAEDLFWEEIFTSCYYQTAMNIDDYSICGKDILHDSSDVGDVNDCYLELAREENNPDVCQYMRTESMGFCDGGNCVSYSAKDDCIYQLVKKMARERVDFSDSICGKIKSDYLKERCGYVISNRQ